MKAYKGLKRNKDGTLECRGFIYEPNKQYTFDGEIKLYEHAFHACRELSDVWVYYPNNGNNVYYEVECGGEIKEHDGDSKFVCSEITLLKEIDTSNVVKFDWAGFFIDGYAQVKLNGKGWNWINRNGEPIGNQWYDDAWYFSEGYAKVRLYDKWNFINRNGELIGNQWYNWVEFFSNEYAAVRLKGKGYNFINRNGELIGNQWYNWVGFFSNEYAAVRLKGKYNFINRNGELIGNQWYDWVGFFSNEYAVVELDSKKYKLRKDGVLCDYDTKQPIIKANE